MIFKLRSACVFTLLLSADRFTKDLVLSALKPGDGAGKFLSLELHFNSGIAFSLLSRYTEWLPALVAGGFVLLLLASLLNRAFRAMPGIPLILAGTAGNLLDRIFYGHVIDWICVTAGPWQIYFNLADIWLCAGGFLFLLHIWSRPAC